MSVSTFNPTLSTNLQSPQLPAFSNAGIAHYAALQNKVLGQYRELQGLEAQFKVALAMAQKQVG